MTYKYDTREVTHGNANGFYAKIAKTDAGTLDLQKPYPFTGLRSTSFETSQESNAYYADNVEHVRLQGKKSTEGSITTYQIPKQFMIDHLGKKLTNSTPPALIDTGVNNNFVWGYAETVTDEFGAEIEEFHIWTNVKASAPKGSTATDETSATPKEIEIPCTASPNNFILDSEKKPVSEIVWRDDSKGTVRGKFDKLFADNSPGKVIDFINEALGITTTPTTTVGGGS
ncbi:phage tail protein [Streptococcus parasuis]|uniref:phage tail protein n=1 Tax=Streptococcus parasuis TaxID=1501662 RepID=UPI0028A6EA15|nr:phage tail protein [Streptococcus parasuis]